MTYKNHDHHNDYDHTTIVVNAPGSGWTLATDWIQAHIRKWTTADWQVGLVPLLVILILLFKNHGGQGHSFGHDNFDYQRQSWFYFYHNYHLFSTITIITSDGDQSWFFQKPTWRLVPIQFSQKHLCKDSHITSTTRLPGCHRKVKIRQLSLIKWRHESNICTWAQR